MLSLWYGHFDTWELDEKIRFDKDNRIIYIVPEITEINVKRDIYSGSKRWFASHPDNAAIPFPIRVIGGDSIGGGVEAGDIYFLQNGWQINIPSNRVDVEGVIYHDDGIPVFEVSEGGSVISTVSALVQTIVTDGSSLSLQDVRDAMTLGPTVPPSSNSIDQKLDNSLTAHSSNAIVTANIQARITSLQMSLSSTTGLVETLLKYGQNRTVVSRTDKTLTVYDDDGVTPLKVFDLFDESAQPSTDDIVERVPR